MKKYIAAIIPFLTGLSISALLYIIFRWWGFLIIFPWIGFSISLGILIRVILKGKKKILGRKISILMILPCLLFFVPLVNNENFQLEGVLMIVLVGFSAKVLFIMP